MRSAVPWWRRDKASHRTDRSADGSTKRRAVPTGSGSPDCSAAACADEAATDGSLDRIIWIGAGRQSQRQPHDNHAGGNSLLFQFDHELRFYRVPPVARSRGQKRHEQTYIPKKACILTILTCVIFRT